MLAATESTTARFFRRLAARCAQRALRLDGGPAFIYGVHLQSRGYRQVTRKLLRILCLRSRAAVHMQGQSHYDALDVALADGLLQGGEDLCAALMSEGFHGECDAALGVGDCETDAFCLRDRGRVRAWRRIVAARSRQKLLSGPAPCDAARPLVAPPPAPPPFPAPPNLGCEALGRPHGALRCPTSDRVPSVPRAGASG